MSYIYIRNVKQLKRKEMQTNLEMLKNEIRAVGSDIYRNGTPEYNTLNELDDKQMENFVSWLAKLNYELRYRYDDDVYIIC